VSALRWVLSAVLLSGCAPASQAVPDAGSEFSGDWSGSAARQDYNGRTIFNTNASVVIEDGPGGFTLHGPFCELSDDDAPSAVLAADGSLSVLRYACKVFYVGTPPPKACDAVQLDISGGTGALDGGTLTLTMEGSFTSCDPAKSGPFGEIFVGRR
jgi:hypothetical protein